MDRAASLTVTREPRTTRAVGVSVVVDLEVSNFHGRYAVEKACRNVVLAAEEVGGFWMLSLLSARRLVCWIEWAESTTAWPKVTAATARFKRRRKKRIVDIHVTILTR